MPVKTRIDESTKAPAYATEAQKAQCSEPAIFGR